jgi:hypothetical protein
MKVLTELRFQFGLIGFEVGERARARHLGQHRVLTDEAAVDRNELDQVGAGVIGVGERVEVAAQGLNSFNGEDATPRQRAMLLACNRLLLSVATT